TTSPQIADVRVDFGSQTASVLIPNRTLPWPNITGIDVLFSSDVHVGQGDLALTGINVPSYSISGFRYDPSTHTAHWDLAAPLRLDLTTIHLDGHTTAGVHDANGHFLLGGDFLEGLNVLPGDVNGDGVVNVTDGFQIRSSNTPVHNYSVFNDLNGN